MGMSWGHKKVITHRRSVGVSSEGRPKKPRENEACWDANHNNSQRMMLRNKPHPLSAIDPPQEWEELSTPTFVAHEDCWVFVVVVLQDTSTIHQTQAERILLMVTLSHLTTSSISSTRSLEFACRSLSRTILSFTLSPFCSCLISLSMSLSLSACLSFVCSFLSLCLFLSVSLCLFLSVSLCLSVCMSLCLSWHLSVCLPACLCVCLSACMPVHPSVALSVLCLSLAISVCLFLSLPFPCLSIRLSLSVPVCLFLSLLFLSVPFPQLLFPFFLSF